MNKKNFVCIGIILLLGFILSACQETAIQPTTDLQGLVATSVALTLQAHSSNPTSNLLPTSQFPTATLRPSGTPLPTVMQLPTYQPPAATKGPCYLMNINDITIPDNTELEPGTPFTKTWRLYNKGSCAWAKSFVIFFFSGDQMGAPASVALPMEVPPGTTLDVSVNMIAPLTDGNYKGNWKMKTPDGTIFGSGSSSASFFVQIVVKTIPFYVNNVGISVDDANPPPNPCGHTFNFTAAITTTTKGTVTYYWTRSDGGTSSTGSLDFTAAGTQNVSYSWTLSASYTGSVSVYIDNPNHQLFGPGGNFTYTCP
jgi:hypothetical protein